MRAENGIKIAGLHPDDSESNYFVQKERVNRSQVTGKLTEVLNSMYYLTGVKRSITQRSDHGCDQKTAWS